MHIFQPVNTLKTIYLGIYIKNGRVRLGYVEEIDPPVIKRNKHKKYRGRILIEPLDPYFWPISINIEDDDTPDFSDLTSTFTIEDISIR
jgi:hypothetical protein